MSEVTHTLFFRQLRDRLINLRRVLTSNDTDKFSRSLDICRELQRHNVKLLEHTLRYEIIMITNQLTAATQILNDPETGGTGREAVKSIIQKISETLTTLIATIDKEMRFDNTSLKPKHVVISGVEKPFQVLSTIFKEKEAPQKLVGTNTEVTFKQSIELLEKYSHEAAKIPIEIDEGFAIFQAPLLIRMRFNIERLQLISARLINTKVGYNNNWIMEDAWIVAIQDSVKSDDIEILIEAAKLLSQKFNGTYVTTHEQWGSWHMPGSPLLYSWLMDLNMYQILRPKIFSLSFPFQISPIKPKILNLHKLTEKRLKFEERMNNEYKTLDKVTGVYHSLLKERRKLEADIENKEIKIKDIKETIGNCEDVHNRLTLRRQITDLIANIAESQDKIKDIQQQIDIVRRDKKSLAEFLPLREKIIREELM